MPHLGNPSDDAVYIENCFCLRETDKALLIQPHKGDDFWVPKSCVHDDSYIVHEGDIGRLAVVAWWAEKEGLG